MAEQRKLRDQSNRPGRRVAQEDEHEKRERGMDQTLEDTYPASDPPSTIPDPEEEPEAA